MALKAQIVTVWPFTEKAGPQIRASVTITLESSSRWSGSGQHFRCRDQAPPACGPAPWPWFLGAGGLLQPRPLGGEERARLPFLGAS